MAATITRKAKAAVAKPEPEEVEEVEEEEVVEETEEVEEVEEVVEEVEEEEDEKENEIGEEIKDDPEDEAKEEEPAEAEPEEEVTPGEEKKTKAPTAAAAVEDDADDVLDFNKGLEKKKKKKPKAVAATAEVKVAKGDIPWAGTDRDYNYTELLNRVFTLLREKNPALSVRKRHSMPPPSILRVGTKRVMFANFATICALLHRQLEHLQSFVLAEFGTEGSIDGNQRLVIKGRYTPKQVENLLKRYIVEYVTCSMCRNPDTTLTRDSVTRLYFIQCDTCGSRRSVAPIKAGYHAANRADRRKAKATAT